jgi:hypothetical protein
MKVQRRCEPERFVMGNLRWIPHFRRRSPDSRYRRAMWPSLPHELILNNLGCLMARREPGHDERTRLAAGNLRLRDREIACWDYPARWWRTVDARCPPPSKGRQNECTPARGRDLRSTGTTRCRTVYGVMLERFFACRSLRGGSVHPDRRVAGRDSFIRAFALEGNKAPTTAASSSAVANR